MGATYAKCQSSARLNGKVAVITGCNTGIGKTTATDFYQRGARVIMACRNLEKANVALKEIKKLSESEENLGSLEVVQLDLASLKSIRTCVRVALAKVNHVDVLVNNAAVMVCPYTTTEDGFEMQFGTNHLGHFLFTLLLLPKILRSTQARIINVSSIAYEKGRIDFNDLNSETKIYSAFGAYAQSKLANILFTKELSRRLKDAAIKNVTTYSLHPGIIYTELGRHIDTTYFWGARFIAALFYPRAKTPEQGAQTTIYCAVEPNLAEQTGLYYEECTVTPTTPIADNLDDAARLWHKSWKLVQLEDDYNPFVVNSSI